jgi:hypothetical protein
MATEQIKSKNSLFLGELIDKPRQAISIPRLDGLDDFVCPNCHKAITPDDCDVIGAEPDCFFCNFCNLEFHA